MKVLVDLSGENLGADWLKHSRMLGLAIRPLLEALVTIDQLYLMTHHVPSIYQCGVVYREEPKSQPYEDFAPIPSILSRGWGDCDDLAPWLCAECRMRGEKAKIRIQWKKLRDGKMYHIVVRHQNGSIEDPSRKLGMR